MTAGEPDIKLRATRNRVQPVSDARAFHAAIVPRRATYAGRRRIECQLNIRGSTGCGAPILPYRGE